MKKMLPTGLAVLCLLTACGDSGASQPPVSENASSAATSDDVQKPAQNSAESFLSSDQTTTSEENDMTIQIVIGSREFSAVLYDNAAAALKDLLPMTLDMSEFNGNEKYNYLSDKLPTDQSSPKKICAGDIMLYGDNCLVLFYEDLSTSFSYTPIGRLNDPEGLAKAVGRGSVTVTWH